jgi:hypothetical protein
MIPPGHWSSMTAPWQDANRRISKSRGSLPTIGRMCRVPKSRQPCRHFVRSNPLGVPQRLRGHREGPESLRGSGTAAVYVFRGRWNRRPGHAPTVCRTWELGAGKPNDFGRERECGTAGAFLRNGFDRRLVFGLGFLKRHPPPRLLGFGQSRIIDRGDIGLIGLLIRGQSLGNG